MATPTSCSGRDELEQALLDSILESENPLMGQVCVLPHYWCSQCERELCASEMREHPRTHPLKAQA